MCVCVRVCGCQCVCDCVVEGRRIQIPWHCSYCSLTHPLVLLALCPPIRALSPFSTACTSYTPLQVRVKQYYRHYLEKKTGLNETTILSELSTYLRQEVAMHVIYDTIKHVSVFNDLPVNELSKLLGIMKPFKCSIGDWIFQTGEQGFDM